jgi:hypothetical protein
MADTFISAQEAARRTGLAATRDWQSTVRVEEELKIHEPRAFTLPQAHPQTLYSGSSALVLRRHGELVRGLARPPSGTG